ncbi:opsin 6, group member b [Hemiscyllium ocellatum]|uniref:opsin 6, group member b n=1 Tax=Hemiscyllium ocellatum TaxID=170820 RepID=UPI00296776C3|nr:opsin 6, group member b [Hemiscyllium ocellatum]
MRAMKLKLVNWIENMKFKNDKQANYASSVLNHQQSGGRSHLQCYHVTVHSNNLFAGAKFEICKGHLANDYITVVIKTWTEELNSRGWLSWIGNGIVISIMYNRRLALEPQDYLTFNLAISDASISIFGYSRGIIEIFNIFQDDKFIITSIWTCEVDGILTLLFGLSSINTLTAISIIRYIKGCKPHQVYRVNKSNAILALSIVWLAALFWSATPLLGWGSYADRLYGTCEIDWIQAAVSIVYKSYVIGIFLCCFFFPVSVMIFSYVSIIKMIRSSHKCVRRGEISEHQRHIEREVTRVSFVICTAFILAWSPYAVISMWSACGYSAPAITSVLACLIAKSASFYNPIIYFGMSPKFRKEVQALFHCRQAKNNESFAKPENQSNVRSKLVIRNQADKYQKSLPIANIPEWNADLDNTAPIITVSSNLEKKQAPGQKGESEHL